MHNGKQNILIAGAKDTSRRIIISLLKASENYKPIAMVRSQEQKKYF
jgi:FlaA1/EpsC-like NDP-sugar epimerase